MCGRYTNDAEFSEIRLHFGIEQLELFRDWRPAYNISPAYGPGSEQLIVLRGSAGKCTLRLARWWFIPPFWNNALSELPTAFNARAEDLGTKSFFRSAFQKTRCLVPATGWREFTGPSGKKQPYHFHLGRRLFAFAGLWSSVRLPGTAPNEVVHSFAIVTTEPSPQAARIHERMPLIMPESSYRAWLDPSSDAPAILAAARAASRGRPLDLYASDPIGNSGRFEGSDVLREAPTPKPVQEELFPDRSRE